MTLVVADALRHDAVQAGIGPIYNYTPPTPASRRHSNTHSMPEARWRIYLERPAGRLPPTPRREHTCTNVYTDAAAAAAPATTAILPH